MKNFSEQLKYCALFENIKEAELSALLTCLGARVTRYERRETVLAEGEEARYIGIVLSGEVRIIQNDFYGNRNILSVISAGEAFAEAFACAQLKSLPVSVIASESSEIMLIEATRILSTCAKGCGFHRQIIYNLMRDIAQKALIYHKKAEITSKRTTREKLLAYLSEEARKHGSKAFEIPFDRQELADYLEVERSGLSSEIGKMTREGLIKSKKNRFELLEKASVSAR